ncbi:carbonic anhydrase [Aspergillus melleus]|uniref:carbonic anhydrase n=1 Tax=Aspergillus melleus TaxID=138277 RepID=UPI001E8CEE76|nr:uncharacterized protein LDX57_005912 [Aspergillus melleus]KAH8428209.1 hypothetical protein LDX57_005912 [Aspergillus melleus]
MNVARLFPRPQSLSRSFTAAWELQGRRGISPSPSFPVAQGVAGTFRSCSTSAPSSSDHLARSHNGANVPSDRFISALDHNKQWAAKTAQEFPDLFPTLAVGQHPEILWIGCSDSRCPETTLLGLKPGDVFVHRNIANVLHAGDLSSSAVIEYAVRHLRVKHVVLCGHTGCGGVAAAMGNKQLGILDPWLLPLRQIRQQNLSTLQSLTPDQAMLKLVELNVEEGVKLLKQKSVVLDAIHERGLQVHGLIFDVASGVLRQLDTNDTEEAIKARLVSFKTE